MSQTTTQHRREVWDAFWRDKEEIDQVYSNSDRVIRQIRALGNPAGKWILEVGAGSGRDSFSLSADGARVVMLDYSQPALCVIQRLAQDWQHPVALVRGDAFYLPFKNDCLDVVFHQGLLEHFTNPEDILAENFRVLKPGAAAVVDVPQRYHLYTAVKHVLILLKKWFAGWESEFSKPQLERLLAAAGFGKLKMYGDWMRPSFCYRAGREVLKKAGVKLPLYPGPWPLLSKVRSLLREEFRRTPLALYTVMDIGAVGLKPEKNPGAAS